MRKATIKRAQKSLYNSRVPQRPATIQRAETERVQIKRPREGAEGQQSRDRKQRLYTSKVPQREEKSDNKESGNNRSYTDQGYPRWRRRATLKRQRLYKSRVPKIEEKGDNKESEREAIQIKGTA